MTKQEKIIVSAYTGYLMCDFDDMHKYIEEKLGRPVWTHELAIDIVEKEIKEKVKPDFIKLCETETPVSFDVKPDQKNDCMYCKHKINEHLESFCGDYFTIAHCELLNKEIMCSINSPYKNERIDNSNVCPLVKVNVKG